MYEKNRFYKALRASGISKHPVTQRNLKHSKITELARLYFELVEGKEKNK